MERSCKPTKKGWTLLHTRILRLALDGTPHSTIATKVGKSRGYVYALVETEEYKKKFANARKSVIEKVQKIFEDSAESAAKTIKHISKRGTPEERVRLDAAKDIIDRVGYKPIQVIETRQRAYSPQEIESAKGTVKELEDTIVRLERKDSIFVLKKSNIRDEKPPTEEPVADAGEPASESSPDRPQTVSA